MSEAAFLNHVLHLARLCGWRAFHQRPGLNRRGKWSSAVQGDGVGFLDILACRGHRLIVAELKVGRNTLTAEQAAWLVALGLVPGVETYLWRPEDWKTIQEVLA